MTTAINVDYAKQKLAAVARAPEQSQAAVRTNAYWRVASECGMFGAALSDDGSLTDNQYRGIEQALEDAGVTE